MILGWLLGLLSPIIVDSIKRRRENNEVRKALETELEELRFRLACIIHRVVIRCLSDQEMRDLAKQYAVVEAEHGLSLKKQLVPLLDSKFALLSTFNASLQNSILEIRAHLNLLNEEVEEARYYFRLTFDSGISSENLSRIQENLNDPYQSYSSQAKIIVKFIGEVRW